MPVATGFRGADDRRGIGGAGPRSDKRLDFRGGSSGGMLIPAISAGIASSSSLSTVCRVVSVEFDSDKVLGTSSCGGNWYSPSRGAMVFRAREERNLLWLCRRDYER